LQEKCKKKTPDQGELIHRLQFFEAVKITLVRLGDSIE